MREIDIEKEVNEVFNNMTDEEFKQSLIDAGFEIIENGNGKIIFIEDEETNQYKGALEKIVTRSMSMYATRDDMLRDIIEIAWKGLGK